MVRPTSAPFSPACRGPSAQESQSLLEVVVLDSLPVAEAALVVSGATPEWPVPGHRRPARAIRSDPAALVVVSGEQFRVGRAEHLVSPTSVRTLPTQELLDGSEHLPTAVRVVPEPMTPPRDGAVVVAVAATAVVVAAEVVS